MSKILFRSTAAWYSKTQKLWFSKLWFWSRIEICSLLSNHPYGTRTHADSSTGSCAGRYTNGRKYLRAAKVLVAERLNFPIIATDQGSVGSLSRLKTGKEGFEPSNLLFQGNFTQFVCNNGQVADLKYIFCSFFDRPTPTRTENDGFGDHYDANFTMDL